LFGAGRGRPSTKFLQEFVYAPSRVFFC
jgi:hypothetical protein